MPVGSSWSRYLKIDGCKLPNANSHFSIDDRGQVCISQLPFDDFAQTALQRRQVLFFHGQAGCHGMAAVLDQ